MDDIALARAFLAAMGRFPHPPRLPAASLNRGRRPINKFDLYRDYDATYDKIAAVQAVLNAQGR